MHTHTQKEGDRHTDIDRHTHRQRDTETDRYTCTQRCTHTHTDAHAHRNAYIYDNMDVFYPRCLSCLSTHSIASGGSAWGGRTVGRVEDGEWGKARQGRMGQTLQLLLF